MLTSIKMGVSSFSLVNRRGRCASTCILVLLGVGEGL